VCCVGLVWSVLRSDTPSGYEVVLDNPQEPDLPGVPATPDLKNAIVTLPAGVSISPSAANGLVACPQTGPEDINLGDHDQADADRIASEQNTAPRQEVQEGEEYDYHDSITRTVPKQVATTLQMPTTLVGQNGTVLTQTTKIGHRLPKGQARGEGQGEEAV
jgi:hypothetical protein